MGSKYSQLLVAVTLVGIVSISLIAYKLNAKNQQVKNMEFPVISKEESQKIMKQTKRQQQKQESLNNWIAKLVHQESSGKEDIVILDTNGRYSYGCLQFQRATFDHYSRLHGIKGDIMDCKIQKRLAFAMISNRYGNWEHWYNSTMKIGYPPYL